MELNKEINISTITLTCKIKKDILIKTFLIGKYIEINDEIKGIKYCNGSQEILRGEYSTIMYKKAKKKVIEKINKRLFYNQISAIIYNKKTNSNFNVKIFSNGSLQITGCKSKDNGVDIIEILNRNINNMIKKTIEQTIFLDENDVYKDIDNCIYSYDEDNKYIYIGFKENGLYNINNKEYEIFERNNNKYFMLKTNNEKKKEYLDEKGIFVGKSCIKLFKNKKKLYTNNKNIIIENDLIFSGDILIGEVVYDGFINEIKDRKINYRNNDFTQKVEIKINPITQSNEENPITITNYEILINCVNVYYSTNNKIDRNNIYKKLIENDYLCKFNPEIYSGIKFTYKYNEFNKENDGKCICETKCICENITFLMFQSGNIIVTGFKSLDIIENIINKVNKFLLLI